MITLSATYAPDGVVIATTIQLHDEDGPAVHFIVEEAVTTRGTGQYKSIIVECAMNRDAKRHR